MNSYEPQERWWSVEVEFDPILDDIFGVVNNKQHAYGFVAGAGFDWKGAALPEETFERTSWNGWSATGDHAGAPHRHLVLDRQPD